MFVRCAAFSLTAVAALSACASHPSHQTVSVALQPVSCDAAITQTHSSAGQVLASCGNPSYRDAWGTPVAQGPTLAPVEEWYYNRGQGQAVQVLRFLNGSLVAVNTDGHGFDGKTPAPACEPILLGQGLSKYRLIRSCGEPLTEQTYVYDRSYFVPNAPVLSRGNAIIVGQGRNVRPSYREDLTYRFNSGEVRTVILQNGRVLEVNPPRRG